MDALQSCQAPHHQSNNSERRLTDESSREAKSNISSNHASCNLKESDKDCNCNDSDEMNETAVGLADSLGNASTSDTKQEHDDSSDSLSPKELGRRGEEAACELLRRKGYIILERNWTCPAGEADIIALDDEAIVFIEVKTRAGAQHGLPEEAVTLRKRVRYERIAGFFLSDYDGPGARVRFDVIGILVLPGGRALARQVVNAFSAGD